MHNEGNILMQCRSDSITVKKEGNNYG